MEMNKWKSIHINHFTIKKCNLSPKESRKCFYIYVIINSALFYSLFFYILRMICIWHTKTKLPSFRCMCESPYISLWKKAKGEKSLHKAPQPLQNDAIIHVHCFPPKLTGSWEVATSTLTHIWQKIRKTRKK